MRVKKWIAAIAILMVLTFGVYHSALHAQLVADDFILVGQVQFSDATAYFEKSFGFGRNEYRPLTALSYAVDRAFWRDNPEGYHLTNLLLHGTAAVLFFLFLVALTGDFLLSLLAGCLFVLHPINTSRIIWISARDGSICSVFLLGALWLFVLSRKRNGRALHLISIALAACALLAYEGAAILPALFFLIEFFFFATGSLRGRIVSSFRRTAWFWLVTAAYLGFWEILFSGSVGAYDLSVGVSTVLYNYSRLLATIFFGRKEWLIAIVYVVVVAYLVWLIWGHRISAARRRLAVFGTLAMLIAFLPYCFTNGFAYRFGYISAFGFSILFAVSILRGFRSARRFERLTFACTAILLCSYYAIADRKLLLNWITAGEIAARIPREVHKLHPNLPEGAVLVFTGVPRVFGQAEVFPTGLESAIQREYPVKVFVRQYDSPITELPKQTHRGTVIFQYRGGDDPLREISPATSAQKEPALANNRNR